MEYRRIGVTIWVLGICLFSRAQTVAEDTNRVKQLNRICLQLSYSDPGAARMYGHTAYALSEKLGWKRGMAEATRYIAAIMVDAASEDSALFYLKRSYDLYKGLGDTEGMIASIYNEGVFQQHTSHYSEAMESFFKGIDLADKSGNGVMVAKGNSLAATVLVQQKDFEKARQYSLRALDMFRKAGQIDGVLECLEMIGYGYMMGNKLKESRPYFLEALRLADSVHNDLVRAKIYTQLVTYSEYSNEPEERLGYLQKAQAIWDKIGPASMYSIANIANIGSLYLDLYQQPALLMRMSDSIKNNRANFLSIA
ncbi:MAG: tetratricopeptide repeat protein, partial [Bacteroidetes bacterium]|nr:tetratricopeptide repeat protein [Bacteroidota bacterium]